MVHLLFKSDHASVFFPCHINANLFAQKFCALLGLRSFCQHLYIFIAFLVSVGSPPDNQSQI